MLNRLVAEFDIRAVPGHMINPGVEFGDKTEGRDPLGEDVLEAGGHRRIPGPRGGGAADL